MKPLSGTIRSYAWGSRTVLAELSGREVPSPGPEAELWLGAHRSSPSTVDGVPLTDLIAADPAGVLGAGVLATFGPRLPYLLKVLAAERPLSLQAHPDAAQAAAGFAAGQPSYVDPYHKPELLVAIDRFEALCGFRAPDASAELLSSMDVPGLDRVVDALRAPGPVADRLRAAVTALLCWPAEGRKALVSTVAARDPLAARLADDYPDDVGVVVALLLNHVTLQPGEAVWMPAGNLHCYLRGTGVEVMAASDNVLRGGLTGKPVDVPELLRVLRFEVLDQPVVRAEPVRAGLSTWPLPVPEAALHRATVDGTTVELSVRTPGIALCLRGVATVDDGRGAVGLRAGEAAFAAAGTGMLAISGAAEVFVASVGLS